MKGLFLGLSVTVTAAIVAAGAFSAQAAGPSAAVFAVGDACAIPGAEADGDILLSGGFGTITSLVERDARVTLHCRGTGITNLSGSGRAYSGFPCAIPTSGGVVQTFDSQASVSASGNGRLQCTYRP